MLRLALIVGGLAAAWYWLNRWSGQSGAWRSAQALRWLVVIMIALLLLLLTVRGGANLILPLLALLLPLLMRWKSLWQPVPVDPEAAKNSGSTVETWFLRMSLNHRTGEMRGIVREGRFKGQQLIDLDLQDLLALWRECQGDPQSVAVLEAYLDRTRNEDWREQVAAYGEDAQEAVDPSVMDLGLAYEILGLQPGAGRDEIRAAHRRLMQRVHPDHGGSTYLAARINQAKDFLLSRLK